MLQIEETHQPDAAVRPHPFRTAPLPSVRAPRLEPPVAPESTRPEEPRPTAAEPGRGLGLLLSFTGALAVMVADVVVIAAVEQSWVLIPGFAVLLLMTAIVFAVIMRLLADNGEDATSDAC